MTDCKNIISMIEEGLFDKAFSKLYGEERVAEQRKRYLGAAEKFLELYGNAQDVRLFSAPGRTEICGNHTDHNHGRVVAASLDLDVIGVAAKTNDSIIKIKSEGFPEDIVDISDTDPKESEKNKSSALIRGTAAGFIKNGHTVGGFSAYTTSNVLKGSGMSSSAAFEVFIGTVLSYLYNEGKVSPVETAKIAQYAENEYFGKPCGLMDQMACSVGGIITINFADESNPEIEKIDFDFSKAGMSLCIVDVGGDHADLTHEYASIPYEMKAVAEIMGVKYLNESNIDAVIEKIPEIREKLGDRAVLRSLHFYNENVRVERMVDALKSGDFKEFENVVLESGRSSFEYLQNVFCTSDVKNQPMSMALCLTQQFLKGKGAFRVHGGGFGGTIQAFVPKDMALDYKEKMEKVFGGGSCHMLSIRSVGGTALNMED